MKIAHTLAAAAALSMAAAPAIAAGNPASSLSVAHASRAATPAGANSRLAGGSGLIFGLVGLVALVVIIAVIEGDKPKSP